MINVNLKATENFVSAGSSVSVTLEKEAVIGRVDLYFATYHRPQAAKIQASIDNKHWYDIEGANFNGSAAKYHQQKTSYLISKYFSYITTKKHRVSTIIPASI